MTVIHLGKMKRAKLAINPRPVSYTHLDVYKRQIVIAHDDDLDGIFEDTKSNWFNVESKAMAEIGNNLQMLARKLR